VRVEVRVVPCIFRIGFIQIIFVNFLHKALESIRALLPHSNARRLPHHGLGDFEGAIAASPTNTDFVRPGRILLQQNPWSKYAPLVRRRLFFQTDSYGQLLEVEVLRCLNSYGKRKNSIPPDLDCAFHRAADIKQTGNSLDRNYALQGAHPECSAGPHHGRGWSDWVPSIPAFPARALAGELAGTQTQKPPFDIARAQFDLNSSIVLYVARFPDRWRLPCALARRSQREGLRL